MDGDLPCRSLRVIRAVTGMPASADAWTPEILGGDLGGAGDLLADRPAAGLAPRAGRTVNARPQDAQKETIVQAAVAAAGHPTPVVRTSGGPGSGSSSPAAL